MAYANMDYEMMLSGQPGSMELDDQSSEVAEMPAEESLVEEPLPVEETAVEESVQVDEPLPVEETAVEESVQVDEPEPTGEPKDDETP